MPERRQLLYLARDFPVPVSSGARLRTYNWVVHLSRCFEVTFAAASKHGVDPSHIEALQGYCRDVHLIEAGSSWRARAVSRLRYLGSGRPPEFWNLRAARAHIAELVRARAFDVVFAERWTWGREILALAPLAVVDAGGLQAPHHAAMLRQRSNPFLICLRPRLARGFARAEAEVLRRAGLVLVQSAFGRRAVDELRRAPGAVVVPSGLDTTYFAPRRMPIDPANIVFFGPLESPAQRDALLHLHRDLLPAVRRHMRNAHLTVLAPRSAPELEALLALDPTLHFPGAVEDPRQELWRAAVAALPLRFGSGSRSRLSQLLAMGVPVVATPQAVTGLDVVSGDGLIIAPDGRDFAQALAQVLLDPTLRADLGRRGRETAQARLSLASTFEAMSERLAEVAAS